MTDAPPKLFISYSWTSPQHKQWVLDLAKELRKFGVDAILDTWDIKEGQDVIKFMEGMVTDSTINKVMMVVDKSYADKADEREGGVGVEAQIISKKIFDNHDQEKFVAIALEKDTEGKLILPVYCQSRMCIDFSEHNNKENYDKSVKDLLRWIFSTPEHEKPPIGTRPNFLVNKTSDSIPAITPYLRVLEAIKEGKKNTLGYIEDYLETFSVEMGGFRIKHHGEYFGDTVVESIENFIPYRAEFIEFLLAITKYGDDDYAEALHKFFEDLIPYLHCPQNIGSWRDTDFDNFKFIIHELFLYTIAILLNSGKFEVVNNLISNNYYSEPNVRYGRDAMVSYREFCNDVPSISAMRKEKVKLHRIPHRASFLKERTQNSGISFQDLMQADFVLFIRKELSPHDSGEIWWYPVTLLYGERVDAFKIFAKAESIRYFDRIKPLLGITKKDDMIPLFNAYANGEKKLPEWRFNRVDPKSLINFDKLATKP